MRERARQLVIFMSSRHRLGRGQFENFSTIDPLAKRSDPGVASTLLSPAFEYSFFSIILGLPGRLIVRVFRGLDAAHSISLEGVALNDIAFGVFGLVEPALIFINE